MQSYPVLHMPLYRKRATLLETSKPFYKKMLLHWKWYSNLQSTSQKKVTSLEMAFTLYYMVSGAVCDPVCMFLSVSLIRFAQGQGHNVT